jgi:DNA-binding XRE family transcriptional regulator
MTAAQLPAEFWLTEKPVRDRPGYRRHQIQAGGVGEAQHLPCATRLGARLRELRLDAGWTQKQMSRRLGHRAGANRVSDWERGFILPGLMVLYRYAAAFGMTVSQLLDGVL